MTPNDVREWVARIDQLKDDPEAADEEEDELHDAVLSAIADDTCTDPQARAAEALRTREIHFRRSSG